MNSSLLAVAVCGFAGALAAGPAPSQIRDRLPLVFEPNIGQFPAGVKYGSRNSDYSLLLSQQGLDLSVRGAAGRVRFSLKDGNPAPALEAESTRPSTTNYFIGKRKDQWRTGVQHYDRVRYRSVYPGVDVVYYGTNSKLEFDFLVAPGADPNRIRMQFDAARPVRLNADGELLVKLGDVELRQAQPVVYQQTESGARVPVKGRYVEISSNEIGFSIGSYDRSRPLVIDPILYSSYVGGERADAGTVIATDAAGRIWLAGYTYSSGIATAGSFHDTWYGGEDLFIARLEPAGNGNLNLVSITYVGGTGDEEPKASYVDQYGQIYIAGFTTSTDFPLGGNAPYPSNKGDRDAFVLKINPSEAGEAFLAFSTYFGGSKAEIASAVTADANGLIYLAGQTSSTEDMPLVSQLQGANRGGTDVFLAVFDPSRAASEGLRYSTYLGGGASDVATGIAVRSDGRIYLSGSTFSTDFPTTIDAARIDVIGSGDVFLAVIDLTRSGLDALAYATYFGGSDYDVAYGMVQRPNGRLLITGYTFSSDFPTAGAPIQSGLAGDTDLFIAEFDPSRPVNEWLTYSTFLGGSQTEVPYAIALDRAGRVLVTGYTLSKNFPTTSGALQREMGGAIDAFIAIVETTPTTGGGLAYATYLGGGGMDVGYAVTVDPQGNPIVAGTTGTRAFPTVDSAYKRYAEGLSEGFVTLFSTGLPQPAAAVPPAAR